MYQVRIKKHVQRQIDALPGYYRQRIRCLIQALANDPKPSQAQLLRAQQNIYRIAIDHYRVVYSIENDILLIDILKVGPKFGPEFYQEFA